VGALVPHGDIVAIKQQERPRTLNAVLAHQKAATVATAAPVPWPQQVILFRKGAQAVRTRLSWAPFEGICGGQHNGAAAAGNWESAYDIARLFSTHVGVNRVQVLQPACA
jgi:hypothetical protein